jgi:hypothetical protein
VLYVVRCGRAAAAHGWTGRIGEGEGGWMRSETPGGLRPQVGVR